MSSNTHLSCDKSGQCFSQLRCHLSDSQQMIKNTRTTFRVTRAKHTMLCSYMHATLQKEPKRKKKTEPKTNQQGCQANQWAWLPPGVGSLYYNTMSKPRREMSRLLPESGQAKRVRAFNRGLGEATEGKWKETKRQIKPLIRHWYITEGNRAKVTVQLGK